ncbi:MAG: response regulator transcription factor [Prevotellaceae bacterium]|jgi:DNA-binding response OmpR family regulator|nr:response regulator transcription factor [Prevotellaceae bacterium]
MKVKNKSLPKILVADDEPVICEILAFNLANEGYETTCVHSAEEALQKLTSGHKLILLDVMMGGMSGYRLAETLRQRKNHIPIIFLTAKDTENDMLTGFSVGGDDYISKPFSIKEVLARVRAVMKRIAATDAKPDKRVFEGIIIDFELKELFLDNQRIPLTKTEFEIVAMLSENPDRIYSREEIIDRIWQETPYITERTVDVHITRLRKKLGAWASIISNRTGFGYRFTIPNK